MKTLHFKQSELLSCKWSRIWLAFTFIYIPNTFTVGSKINQNHGHRYPPKIGWPLPLPKYNFLYTCFVLSRAAAHSQYLLYQVITHTFSSTCFVFAEGIRTYEGSKCEFYCWLQTSVGKIGHMLWNCVFKTLLCKNAPFILHTLIIPAQCSFKNVLKIISASIPSM